MTSRRASNTASNLVYIHRACGPQLKLHSETVRAPNTAFDGLVAAALDIAKQDTALRRTLKEATALDGPRILYTRQEAARLLSVSVRTIDRVISTKALVVRRIGRSVLIPHVELMKLSRRDVVNV